VLVQEDTMLTNLLDGCRQLVALLFAAFFRTTDAPDFGTEPYPPGPPR
jgi:hypothetical protein